MATAAVAEAAADAAEVVAEEATEFADAARGFTGRELTMFAIGTLVGTVGGAVGGYFLSKIRLERKYMELADEVVEREMANMQMLQKQRQIAEEPKPDLDKVVAELGYKENGKVPYDKVEATVVPEEAEAKPELANVFSTPQPTQEETEPTWDWATEVKSRTDDDPFIIHRDEWSTGEMDYEQVSLTYYEGDDVLAGERDNIIEDPDTVIGLGNMLKWGHGSGDPNVLYIRNPILGMDIEVSRSMGTYASEVHGLDDETELRHSGHRVRPRRRFDDDERT